MKDRILTVLAVLSLAAGGPALAEGDGGGGGFADRQQEVQQQQEEEQEAAPPPESILDSIDEPAPAAAPSDAASLAAQDFYSKVVAHLDSVLTQQREKLKALDTRIAGIDHKMASDFAHARADDKTTEDAIDSARTTIGNKPKSPAVLGIDVSKTSIADQDMVAAGQAIVDFRTTAETIKALEAARADMAAAGRASGAAIN